MILHSSIGVAFVVMLTVAASTATPQSPSPAQLDLGPTLSPILKKHKTPALFGAIVDGDQVTALGAVGVRKAGEPEQVTPEDLVHLGSDTKAMTAMLVGQLIESGQLKFETTMDNIFPDLAAHMNTSMAKVTVRQLLDHTSGLPRNAASWWAYDRTKESLVAQRRAVVKDILSTPPLSEPGTKYLYSNTGFVILGAILEQKINLPWEEIIRKRIFLPLKMKSAGFGPPGPISKIEEPWGHTLEGNILKPLQFDNAAVMGPAGSVHCTMSDWAKFIAQYLKPHAGEPILLSADLQRELIQPPLVPEGSNYAGGWEITQRSWAGVGKATVLTHAGSNTMWYCVAWLAPKKDFAVLAATNLGRDDASAACNDVSAALIHLHEAQYHNPYQTP